MNDKIEPEMVALVLRRLETKVAANLKLAKAELSGYNPGDKRTFRSPVDGQRLGSVYRTDPDAQWVITDRDALLAHLAEFPGNLETRLEIPAENMPEALAVIHEHAPELLRDFTEVRDDVIQAALDQSKATGQPAAPGIELRTPGGVLTVKPDPQCDTAIQGLIHAGLIAWDGQRAIEPAQQRAAS